MGPPPFQAFVQSLRPQSPLREAITSAYRRPEPQCLPPLIEAATLPAETMAEATALARRLVERLRAKGHGGGVEGLIHEYALSSQEGVALMCLAEALLRIPDDETRDALIRDKIGGGDWEAHLGHSRSLFVNAATWGLLLTGKLTATHSERGLSAALTRLVAKGGEPLIRAWRQSRHAPDGRAVRLGPDDRGGAGERPAVGAPRASAIPTTCWARRRSPPTRPCATSPTTSRRSARSASRLGRPWRP